VAAGALFSTGGAAIKAATLSGWQVACLRSGIAALMMLVALPEARRALRGSRRWRIVPVAAAYAATLVLFVLANRLTTSANAIFLQATAPLYLLLIGPLVLGEPIGRADMLFMGVVVAGMALVFHGTEAAVATATDPPRGNLLALASGMTFALMLAGLRWLARGHDNPGVAAAALGNLLACAATLPMTLPLDMGGPGNWAVVLYLGLAQVGLAYICLTRAMAHVPAIQVSTLLMIEPALNPVWTWLVHGERPGAWALAGGAVILSATLANTWRQSRAAG